MAQIPALCQGQKSPEKQPSEQGAGTELPFLLLSPGAGLCSWQKSVTEFFLFLVHNKSRALKKVLKSSTEEEENQGSNGGLGTVSRPLRSSLPLFQSLCKVKLQQPFSR